MDNFNQIKESLLAHGITLLVEESDYINKSKKYNYQCKNNHIWKARLSDVLFRGLKRVSKGCPHCAGESLNKLSLNIAQKNLSKNHTIIDYELKQVKNDGTKERFYKIQCEFGHF